jgi:predicted SnoaL-like aldol condensation-catalyzing enzyme
MTQRTLRVAVAGLLLSAPLAAQQAPQTSQQLDARTKVVMEFYRPGITAEERIALLHQDYQQHNATYVKYARDHKVSNHEAFRQIRLQQQRDQQAAAAAARTAAAQRGPSTPAQAPAGNTFHILYAEGDTVVRIAQRWTPDPASPGAFYETFFWDTFTVRDGKLYEHWDAAVIADPKAPAPAAAAPPAAAPTVPVVWPPANAVPVSGCTATAVQIAENKSVASEFFRPGITPAERLALVDPGYVQHNPVFRRYALQNKVSDYEAFKALAGGGGRQGSAGRAGGAPQASAGPQPPAGNPLERVVAACDIVTIIHKVYSQDPTMPPGTFYDRYTWDTFRVRNGKLVEHWDGAVLPAPAPAAATN